MEEAPTPLSLEPSCPDLTEKHTVMTVYFANPYHSWERGANENANDLLRRYFPKGTPFATLSPRRLRYRTRTRSFTALQLEG